MLIFGQWTFFDLGIKGLFDWMLAVVCNDTFGGVSGLADSCVVVETFAGCSTGVDRTVELGSWSLWASAELVLGSSSRTLPID